LSVGDILQPAIDIAENGYPVAPITAHLWDLGSTGEMITALALFAYIRPHKT